MSTTAGMPSTVDLPFRKPDWFSERLFSPTAWFYSRYRILSSRIFPIVSNKHIGLYDEASSRAFSSSLMISNLSLSITSSLSQPIFWIFNYNFFYSFLNKIKFLSFWISYFYILIMDEKVLVLCQKWPSKFSSNLYVLRPPESEKMVFTKVSVCPSICLSVCLSVCL